MKLTSYPFSKLPFPKLFQDYISGENTIHSFFDSNPFEERDIQKKINQAGFTGDREKLVHRLKQFNERFNAPEETYSNIKKLTSRDTFTIVTGQQLTLYGGPLFTIYKILTAIQTAKLYEKKYSISLVPVFWLADEDHDYDEISSLGIPSASGIDTVTLESTEKTEFRRVSDIELDENFELFRNNVVQSLPKTDFSSDLIQLLDQCYKPGNGFADAFGRLILSLFGKHGLVLAGSNSEALKEAKKETLIRSVTRREAIFKALNTASDKLAESGYHKQVHVQQSNLFWLDENQKRLKIHYEKERWFIDEDETATWNYEELIDDIDKKPERFSPNVFLRPVLQDHFLPTLAYVAGPGEISYYAQMKEMYSEFEKAMPLIIPRFSATIIESGIERIMDKLPFSFETYTNRIEELETEYINQTDAPDLEYLFSKWKKEVEQLTDSIKTRIADIDPTLEGTAGKASATYFTELDKLKGKLYRSIKQQEVTQLKRIAKIKENLFPNHSLQEREIAFIYYMNKYGMDIWSMMYETLISEQPDSHKLFHL